MEQKLIYMAKDQWLDKKQNLDGTVSVSFPLVVQSMPINLINIGVEIRYNWMKVSRMTWHTALIISKIYLVMFCIFSSLGLYRYGLCKTGRVLLYFRNNFWNYSPFRLMLRNTMNSSHCCNCITVSRSLPHSPRRGPCVWLEYSNIQMWDQCSSL